MRRWILIGLALAALVAMITLWLPTRPRTSSARVDVALAEPDFVPIAVRAAESQEGLTLTGTVRDPSGAPIAGAEISLAASHQQSLTSHRCGVCGEPLLSCRAQETSRAIANLMEGHRGELFPGLTTTSDSAGRFRFEHLSGTSFTVWARALGHGEGVKERAAPGDPVELFLPVPRSLAGVVRDEGGAPLAATVRIVSRRIAHPLETSSTADGAFRFDGLGEGPFFVAASAPGRLPVSRLQVEAGPAPISLTLVGPRRLEVHLLSGGSPVEGVVMLHGDHVARELAAPGGTAVIDALYPQPLMVSAVAGDLASAPQRVTLSRSVTSLTLALDRGGQVLVTVVDEAGQPVPDPTVELQSRAHEVITRRKLKTGELGVLGPLGQGEYELKASAEGFQPTTVPVVLKGGEIPVEVTLNRGTLIAGRVIDEYGRPAPGVAVLVTPTGDSVTADAEGRFRAAVPSPGLYTLQGHHSDWGGGEVRVTAPKSDVELQLEPRAGAEVTVTVDGRRVEGAHAVLYHQAGNFRSDRPSGADGVVLMRGLPTDTYTLIASHPEYLPSDRQSVSLEDGQLVRVSAALKPGAAIRGQVVDTLGAPVAAVAVAVTPRGSEPATTDSDGNFTLSPLRPKSSYSVRVTQRGFEQVDRTVAVAGGDPVRVVVKRQPVFRGRVLSEGQPLKSFRVDQFEVTSSDGRFELALPASDDRVVVTVEAPGFTPLTENRPNTSDLGDFELKRAPRMRGVVREESGGPVSDAVVTCDACEQSVLTGPDGDFSLGRPPLQKEIKVVAKKGRRTATRAVTEDSDQGIELVLKPGVQMSGTAWLPNGRAASGVEISGVHADRSEAVSVVTNADGTYSMEVPPGLYRFIVANPGYEHTSQDPPALITEISGTQARVDFGLVPGLATVTARISPQSGYALWLLRGVVRAVGNPPTELLRSSWAQVIYQPRTERVTFGGLSPGRYSLVWGSFHATMPVPPIIVPVDVPSAGEISVVR